MKLWVVVSLTLGLLMVRPFGSHAVQNDPRSTIDFDLFQLENGLRVILSEDHSAPTFSIAVVYDVGSRNEEPGKTGFAHLFEHMMFQGSENVGRAEHAALIQVNGGGMGGAASVDQTHFYQTLPANQFDLALYLEADRMRSLDVSQNNFDTAREAVRDERRVRHDNQAYGLTYDTVIETAYDSFEYSHPTLGPMNDLDRATLEDVREFYRVYFAPNNAVIALVGDLDTQEALVRIERYFGNIGSQPDPPAVVVNEPPQTQERRTNIDDRLATLPGLDIAYRVPPGNSPQWYMLAILADVLLAPESGRLVQRLVLDSQMAVDVGGGIDERRGNSLFQISVLAAPGVEVEDLEAIIYDEIETLSVDLIQDWELELVRTQMELTEAESARSTLARAVGLATNMVFYDDPDLVNRTTAIRESITRETIRRATEIYLRETNRTVVVTLPSGSGTVVGGRRP